MKLQCDRCDAAVAEVQHLKAKLDQAVAALDGVLIKVDWNSDEFHNAKQYNETRQLVLEALKQISQGER